MQSHHGAAAALGLVAAVCAATAAHGQAASTAARGQAAGADTIDVIGTTPLGAGLDVRRIAANVQSASGEQIREQGALDLADFMRRSLGSVFVNDAQNNPLQPDVQYRGFVGSPLLGLPQGLAVYQDGVRVNEPLGDTVSWALIPESAIDSVVLMPGSNPLFGLNALGGAISLRTKNGFDNAGTNAETLVGSWGRFGLQAETGGSVGDSLGWFVTASHLEEDGWRDFSPTDAQQLFAKLSLRNERQSLDATFTYADTDLIGNGAVPEDLLEVDRAAVFTRPDQTKNRLAMLALRGTQELSGTVSLTGTLYRRQSDVATLNGDDSDFEECEATPGFVCEEDDGGEEIALDANGDAIAADDELEGATVNRTDTNQESVGFDVQASFTGDLGGRDNLFTLGVAHDESDVGFVSSTELGSLDPTRLALPGGVLLGESFVGLDATIETTGLYLTNTFSFGDDVALTLSGRYNRTSVELEDRIDDDLSGEHPFRRFNPAAGVTWDTGELQLYAGYSEANRAPSPVELTCADPEDPCRLPNAFVSDPPLEQVVAKTLEAGVRGEWSAGRWHAGLFHTTNDDDIIFISAGAFTNSGYFDNVGETRREGIEINVSGDAGERVAWFVDFTQLSATFRENFIVASPNNPAAVDGEVEVQVGDRLPLVPNRLIKAGLRFAASERVTLGADFLSSSGSPFRGDEGNLVEKLEDYSLVNFRMEYELSEHAKLFVNVDNVLDEEYETFGAFGEADEVLGDDFDSPEFLGPGAPRAFFIGVRLAF